MRCAQAGEAFDIGVALGQPGQALTETFHRWRDMDAGAASLEAGPVLGLDGKTQQLAGAQADDDVETLLGIGDLLLEVGPAARILRKPLPAGFVVPHAQGDGDQPAEGVPVPQQRPQPRQQTKDDPAPIHDGHYPPVPEVWDNFTGVFS